MLFILPACNVFKKATVSPCIGSWAYEATTPDGTFTGTLTFTEVDGALAGAVASDQELGNLRVGEVTCDAGQVAFLIYGEETGDMSVKGTLANDVLTGTFDNVTYGDTGMTITASRVDPNQ